MYENGRLGIAGRVATTCSENRVDAASRRVACPAKPLHAARRRVYGVRKGFSCVIGCTTAREGLLSIFPFLRPAIRCKIQRLMVERAWNSQGSLHTVYLGCSADVESFNHMAGKRKMLFYFIFSVDTYGDHDN
jgi:hypothetical protein